MESIGGASAPIRVLCVGDSHTYGLWVKPEESYPARLEAKLSTSAGRVTVLNAGVPGMNSSQLRDTLPDLLDSFAPDVVLLMVGVADFWNRAGAQAKEVRSWRWILRGGEWWDRSRVVKLARLIRFNLRYRAAVRSTGAPVVEQGGLDWKIQGGTHEISGKHEGSFYYPAEEEEVVRRVLRRDLSTMASAIQARGVTLVLMTYAPEVPLYSTINEVYRDFAHKTGLPLIDLARRLAEWSEPPGQTSAYFPDFHPRPAGYELIATVVAEALPAYLRSSIR
jgi:lysophospholipase L1-like esterase